MSGRQVVPAEKPSKAGIIICIVIIVILIIILVIVVILYLGKKGTPGKCTASSQCGTGMVCNTTTGVCRDCAADSDCPSGVPHCSNGLCFQCTASSQCRAGLPICDIAGQCVQCIADSGCPAGTAPSCFNGTCVQCSTDAQCLLLNPSTPTCDTTNHVCHA